MALETIIKQLNDGPAILFVGQNYLSMESGEDPLLEKVRSKFQFSEEKERNSYSSFIKLGLTNDAIGFFQWMQGLGKSISLPGWLEYIGKYRWAAVYTTAYDTILERAFVSETRDVQPVVNERYIVNDPRNKNHLHISYLLGYIATIGIGDRPPLTALELLRRKPIAGSLLNRLSTIVTPKGLLVIDGYDVNDQLSVEDFFGYLSKLGQNQVLLCSASQDLLAIEIVKDLIEAGVIYASEKSFASLLSEWETQGKVIGKIPDSEDYYGKWLTILGQRIRLPEDIYSKVSKYAFIPDDATFKKEGELNDDERYQEFRQFLSSSNLHPDWRGYSNGFAFKRDFYLELKKITLQFHDSKERVEAPIIISGQTSSGKTIALGQLVYDLRIESEYPVLFIPKRYQRADEYTIDLFCSWAEQQNAKNTVIVWDGMLEIEAYYSLLQFLSRRGRNVIIVGSSYSLPASKANKDSRNFINAPIQLEEVENKRFIDFIKKINTILANNLQSLDEPNLLALLYRYLPVDRSQIISGIHDEYNFFIRLMRSAKLPNEDNKTTFYEALSALGFSASVDDSEYLNKTLFLPNEHISVADFLIFSVMVAGQYGLNVPFELLLDSVGYDAFGSQIFQALNEVDLIKWFEDEAGNIDLGPRTTLEAQLLSRYAGGKRAEIIYIVELLKGIRTTMDADFGAFDRQIEFAVQLLGEIGPNSSNIYVEFYYEITDLLNHLRESRQAYHPRLVLKEAFFLRSIVKYRREIGDVPETDLDLLQRAEEIVRATLDELGGESERMIAAYLRVELSSVCGYIAQQYISLGEREIAKECYYEVRRINNFSFTTNPGNYRALDIAYWTTEKMLEAKVFDEIEKAEAESDLLSLFEMVEAEGVSNEHLEEFDALKLKFYELIGKNLLAEEVFESMIAKGFTAGIYLKAKGKLGFTIGATVLNEDTFYKNHNALTYLLEYFEEVKDDGRCLFLLLKTWWIDKARKNFFGEEKQTVAFTVKDWDFCLYITGLLIVNADKFLSATIIYIRAIAQFHIGEIKPSIKTFRELQDQSYKGAYGRRRIAKYYLYSTNLGLPKEFEGEVIASVSRNKNEKRGEIYVAELDVNIPFFLGDFGQNSFQKGDKIRSIHIAFNFLGPIAVPAKN